MDWRPLDLDNVDASPGGPKMPFGQEHPSPIALMLNIVIHLISTLQVWISWQLEFLHSTAFSLLCVTTRAHTSRELAEPQNSAVVVMGGGEGLGRMLSLRLASAGYTVFACLPHDVPTPRGASSTISPLLYSWQSRKARTSQSRHHASPGTIVPLVFDASLADDCERAKDTILAYCNQHSLNLRTLLVPPITPSPNSRISGGTSPIRSRQSSSSGTLTPALVSQGAIWKPSQRGRLPPLPGPLIHTTQASMHDAMSRCIFQPLGMIQALASMLHESRSQVIFVSGCDETSFRSNQGVDALCDAARARTASTLQTELGPLGILVSHVTFGPSQVKAMEAAASGDTSVDNTRRISALISLLWAVDDHTSFSLIKNIMEARYPRTKYHFGIDILLQNMSEAYLPSDALEIGKKIALESVRWMTRF